MRLLSEALATIRARIGTRLYVNASVLQQGALLLELLLAYWTAHVEGHSGRPTVLDDIWKRCLVSILVEVLQLGEISTEYRMIHTFGIFEVSWVLQRSGYVAYGRETGPRLRCSLGCSVFVKVLLVLQLNWVDSVRCRGSLYAAATFGVG